ncbi:hypothetical protein ABGV42_00235 [Paenibacillus pabuli]|uniref:hypothetical protein n=1 Tax=Paenibacillus pabuli TaxID=1472 RepID=UPI003241EEE0
MNEMYIEWNEQLKTGLFMIETVNNGATRRAVVTKNPDFIPYNSRARGSIDQRKKLQICQEHNGKTLMGVYDVWRNEVHYIYAEVTNYQEVHDDQIGYYSGFHDAEFSIIGLVYLDGVIQRMTYATRNPQLLAMIAQVDAEYYSAVFSADPHAFYDLLNNDLLRSDEIVSAIYITSLYAEYLKVPRPMITEFQSSMVGTTWR